MPVTMENALLALAKTNLSFNSFHVISKSFL